GAGAGGGRTEGGRVPGTGRAGGGRALPRRRPARPAGRRPRRPGRNRRRSHVAWGNLLKATGFAAARWLGRPAAGTPGPAARGPGPDDLSRAPATSWFGHRHRAPLAPLPNRRLRFAGSVPPPAGARPTV